MRTHDMKLILAAQRHPDITVRKALQMAIDETPRQVVSDEGFLEITVGNAPGVVVLQYPTEIGWHAMPIATARSLAKALQHAANQAERKQKKFGDKR